MDGIDFLFQLFNFVSGLFDLVHKGAKLFWIHCPQSNKMEANLLIHMA